MRVVEGGQKELATLATAEDLAGAVAKADQHWFLAAIAALYVTMSVGRLVGRSVGLSVPNEFQEVQKP